MSFEADVCCWGDTKLFNYYKRIAEYANELEGDGNIKKSKYLKEILKSENRCIFCGSIMIRNNSEWICSKCKIESNIDVKQS